MTAATASGSTAVMAQRRKKLSDGEPWQNLELFPTPPWAARVLPETVLPQLGLPPRLDGLVWEPAAGLGHMAHGLSDYANLVHASDVYLYPLASGGTMERHDVRQTDFLAENLPDDRSKSADAGEFRFASDWIITNPPFAPAAEFLTRALTRARTGVALLLRMQWLESSGRYGSIFIDRPPVLVAQFAERVPMCEGGFDPQLSSATAYAWFVWLRDSIGPESGSRFPDKPMPENLPPWRRPHDPRPGHLDFWLIPPGQQAKLTRDSDRALAARHVPGWISPRLLKKGARGQDELFAGAIR